MSAGQLVRGSGTLHGSVWLHPATHWGYLARNALQVRNQRVTSLTAGDSVRCTSRSRNTSRPKPACEGHRWRSSKNCCPKHQLAHLRFLLP